MATEYLSKAQAVAMAMAETGYGKRIIDRVMDRLSQEGRITVELDFDGRTYRISRADVSLIIQVLKREIK